MEEQPSFFSDALSGLRTITPKHNHDKLKSVRVDTFYSVKMLVEFICQVVESATALERLTLETTDGTSRCWSNNASGKCPCLSKERRVEARRSCRISSCSLSH